MTRRLATPENHLYTVSIYPVPVAREAGTHIRTMSWSKTLFVPLEGSMQREYLKHKAPFRGFYADKLEF